MTLQQALINRDGIEPEEADKRIEEMKNLVMAGDDPEEVLHNEGFEPDYIFDLIDFI